MVVPVRHAVCESLMDVETQLLFIFSFLFAINSESSSDSHISISSNLIGEYYVSADKKKLSLERVVLSKVCDEWVEFLDLRSLQQRIVNLPAIDSAASLIADWFSLSLNE
jgi:hypothetical protein